MREDRIIKTILETIDTVVDSKIKETSISKIYEGTITKLHETSSKKCYVSTPSGTFECAIPAQFAGIGLEAGVIVTDLYGDNMSYQITAITRADEEGNSGGNGGGGSGSGSGLFRLKDSVTGEIITL